MASAGVALLDRTTFNAPGVGVNGIAVASGKDGIVCNPSHDPPRQVPTLTYLPRSTS